MEQTKKKKTLKIYLLVLLSLCLVVGIYALSVNFYVVHSAKPYMLSQEDAATLEDVDCILVLGCRVWSDGVPSDMLRDRLDGGIALYKAGAAPKLLMSGDHGKQNYNEVGTMKQYAIDAGIASEDVFMDHAGFSTYESMYRARDIFKAKKILIVTQEYHLSRAIYIARSLGLEAYGVPSDYHTYGGALKRGIREILARNKEFLTGIVKPDPTYLGDAIPVSGNGDLTND